MFQKERYGNPIDDWRLIEISETQLFKPQQELFSTKIREIKIQNPKLLHEAHDELRCMNHP
jgi:hypothetical protein